MTETDILGFASNLLGSLTVEQQQQLNGLIDGALAQGSLASSPTLKSALVSLTHEFTASSPTAGLRMSSSSPTFHPANKIGASPTVSLQLPTGPPPAYPQVAQVAAPQQESGPHHSNGFMPLTQDFQILSGGNSLKMAKKPS